MCEESNGTKGMAALYLALAKAQGMVMPVEKAAKNEFHRYKYASADMIMEEAGKCLSAVGLCIIPMLIRIMPASGDLTVPERKKDNGKPEAMASHFIARTYRLAHGDTGASIDLEQVPWPVVPESGRPIDKAIAGALTTSFAYFLRDLLCMPRVDEQDNMDADRKGRGNRQEPQREAQPPAEPQKSPQERLHRSLWARATKAGLKADEKDAWRALCSLILGASPKSFSDVQAEDWIQGVGEMADDEIVGLVQKARERATPKADEQEKEPQREAQPPAEPPVADAGAIRQLIAERVRSTGIEVPEAKRGAVVLSVLGVRSYANMSPEQLGALFVRLNAMPTEQLVESVRKAVA